MTKLELILHSLTLGLILNLFILGYHRPPDLLEEHYNRTKGYTLQLDRKLRAMAKATPVYTSPHESLSNEHLDVRYNPKTKKWVINPGKKKCTSSTK